jgi:hypothetical protein
MQGIRYKYKLIIAYMSDTTEYKLCEYTNLEDKSIKISENYKKEEELNLY